MTISSYIWCVGCTGSKERKGMFVNVMTKQQAKKAKKAAERYEVRAYAGFREDWRDWKKKKTIWTDWKIRKIVVWRRSRVRIRVRIRER